MRTTPAATAALITVALALTACGSSEDEAVASDGCSSGDSGADPVTVTDTRGEEISLDEPADTVVALEWQEAEDLTALGVMPAGVAQVGDFKTWVDTVEIDDACVTDVGLRSEPSMDAIAGLQPDLIITEGDRSKSQIGDLEEIAPVLVTDGTDQSDNIGQMRSNLEMIATAIGKEDVAQQLLGDLEASIESGRQAIEEAGLEGTTFAAAHGWTEGGSVSIRMFGEGSLFSDVAEELGLSNDWDGKVDEWGLTTTDVEAMTQLGDTHFMYIAPEDNVFAEALPDNPIWQGLPFVEKGNVHELDGGTWAFGGPKSCEQLVDEIVGALTS
ncbi:MAG TPA: iron-siderophore ABC transporter substrate-binding protein [Nocardioidaceae bacterium]|nr:iron-siderophore ABC transporter substrate-binding protein [Nocardioidaceae bacterium]